MSARDRFHNVVRIALERDGWAITHDPYSLQAGGYNLAIDLGAEELVAAEREGRKIAVEIKSFLATSKITEFYAVLGQFIAYRTALQGLEPERTLYLAVPVEIYDRFFLNAFIQEIASQNRVFLFTYSVEKKEIVRWHP